MSNTSALSEQVAAILDTLWFLPGRKGISVQTRRFPRFLPAEDGVGFQQRDWSFSSQEKPTAVAIPPDAEEIRVTWVGAPCEKTEVSAALKTTVSDLSAAGIAWDFNISTRRNGNPQPELVVEVFRSFELSGN